MQGAQPHASPTCHSCTMTPLQATLLTSSLLYVTVSMMQAQSCTSCSLMAFTQHVIQQESGVLRQWWFCARSPWC
eukprot:1032896-Amphidinium_carterae.1